MPFAYFGAKHGLARKYPAPLHGTVIEPFAGAAGYSVHHMPARVILVERDPAIAELWREVLAMTPERLRAADAQLLGDRTRDPLIMFMSGAQNIAQWIAGRDAAVTPRMHSDWPYVRRRLVRVARHADRFTLIEGDYSEAPDIPATWFVDPPYEPHGSLAGLGYRHGATGIDYHELGDWCQARRGQVIVCEQHPAEWLPFKPIANQRNGYAGASSQTRRTEVMWYREDHTHTRKV